MSDTSSKPATRPELGKVDSAQRPAQPEQGRDQRSAPDPTRYGDWEKNGRCIDF